MMERASSKGPWMGALGLVIGCCTLSAWFSPAHGQGQPPAEESPKTAGTAVSEDLPPPKAPDVELVFIGVSDDMYSLFGHAAILIRSPGQAAGKGRLFNFGVTSFNEENYAQRFIGGRVNFWVSAQPYARQLERWKTADRSVKRYPLQLSPLARGRLVEDLERAILPENRAFLYDTFRANCATRLRDLLDEHTQGLIHEALTRDAPAQSFRDDVRMTYSKRPIYLVATELVAGVELDRPRTDWALTYRPEHMEMALETVTLRDGTPLLGAPQIDHKRQGPEPRNGWPKIGVLLILALAIAVATLAALASRVPPMARSILGTIWILGASGFGVLLFWVGQTSDWPEMQNNPLVWMYLPSDLILLWAIWGRSQAGPQWLPLYLGIRLVLGGALLLASPFLFELSTPMAPKVLSLAGLLLLWQICTKRDMSAVGSPIQKTAVALRTQSEA